MAARDKKNQLLYTLNAFRSIQKRLTLELREFGSRDRVMGDCNIIRPNEKQNVVKDEDADGNQNESADDNDRVIPSKTTSLNVTMHNQKGGANIEAIDNVVMDEMVDINRYRFNNCFTNK